MSDTIVQLEDTNGNNIYPMAGGMAPSSVSTAMVANGAVTGAANSDASVDTSNSKVALNTIGTPNLRDGAVTSDKIDFTTFTYSTTEKAIGIDTDGKTIYQKVFTGTTDSSQNTYLTIVSSGSTFNLIHFYGAVNRTDGYRFAAPYGNGSSDYIMAFVQSTANQHQLRVNYSTNHASCAYRLVVEYTKN